MYIIDTHIHLDLYKRDEFDYLIRTIDEIETLISVSYHLPSCKTNLMLANAHSKIKPAFGYHPEQKLPTELEMEELFNWIRLNEQHMIAVGEVGLPYYLEERKMNKQFPFTQYVELLEEFILLTKELNKPIILHAVYEDASIVCDLLEKHNVHKAHFHWFKGEQQIIERLIQNGYYISVTPDVVYKEKIQQLVSLYPIEKMMVETDGPWPFEGPFREQLTHPSMIPHSIETIAHIKQIKKSEASEQLFHNAKNFYSI